eukprot:scaffold459148_cov46-Prasinocladus_malaysianus.AAC.1
MEGTYIPSTRDSIVGSEEVIVATEATGATPVSQASTGCQTDLSPRPTFSIKAVIRRIGQAEQATKPRQHACLIAGVNVQCTGKDAISMSSTNYSHRL